MCTQLILFIEVFKVPIEKAKEYENYGNLSSIVMGASAISLFFLLIIKFTFEWSFSDYFTNFFKGTFILVTVIDAIPNFLEKNVNV